MASDDAKFQHKMGCVNFVLGELMPLAQANI